MKYLLYFIKRVHSLSGKILYLNLIAMILISLFEGVGIFLLVPLISVTGFFDFSIQENTPISWVSGSFTSFFPETLSLTLILCLYVLIMIGQSFFQRNQLMLNSKIQQKFARYLREETYKALLQSNWEFFLKRRKSDLINTMISETGRVSGGTSLFLQFASSLVFTSIQLVVSFLLSAKLTIFVLIFGVGLVFFSRKFIKNSSAIGEENVKLSQTFLAGMTDHFNGIKDIKSNNLEESHITWFGSLNDKIEKNVVELIKLKTTSQFIYKVVSALLIAGFVFMSVKIFQGQSAQLLLILVIFSRIWPRIAGIQSNLEQLGAIIPSFKALLELQKECLEAKELNEWSYIKEKPILIEQGLKCHNLFFRYNKDQNSYALKGINLQIPANCMTAVVGPSGAGKSTLIDLIMGLLHPEEGQILIDNIPLSQSNILSWRQSISYVSQDPFLFNGSIRENLLMIHPDATVKEVWDALEFAVAADFVRKLPQGLDSIVGDRGVRLSGGERQRLVLARAILKKPSILVLDEATSALDTENERKIQEAIERLKGKMTIIVIAHRLSTIRNADQVIVLDQGKIVQTGGFNQLAKEKRGLFCHLLGNQQKLAIRD